MQFNKVDVLMVAVVALYVIWGAVAYVGYQKYVQFYNTIEALKAADKAVGTVKDKIQILKEKMNDKR